MRQRCHQTGFFHADPHPGNIFVNRDGTIGLIDFGQVKQISRARRMTLARVMVALADARSAEDVAGGGGGGGDGSNLDPTDLELIGRLAVELGVAVTPGAKAEGPAAVACWLFDGKRDSLPGGYDTGELSPNSPLKELKSFPQELVLVGRATVLIKGIASRLGVKWSLAEEWAPIARRVLEYEQAGAVAPGPATLTVARPTTAGRLRKAAALRRLAVVVWLRRHLAWGTWRDERVHTSNAFGTWSRKIPTRSNCLNLVFS